MAGSLTVVGSGMRSTQLTPEAQSFIASADDVFYVVPDALTEHAILDLAPGAVDLGSLYGTDRRRTETYEEMVETVLAMVEAGRSVCAVFYGHPGVFVDPGPEMMRRARASGFPAHMFPGVSAADALYADLGLDPGRDGIQMFSAADFLIRRRAIDTSVPLILWQLGALGQEYGATEPETGFLDVLVDRLAESYPRDHSLIVYEASGLIIHPPTIDEVPLTGLREASITRASTLFVPPTHPAEADADMALRLGALPD